LANVLELDPTTDWLERIALDGVAVGESAQAASASVAAAPSPAVMRTNANLKGMLSPRHKERASNTHHITRRRTLGNGSVPIQRQGGTGA
jgi:hypothetical protein